MIRVLIAAGVLAGLLGLAAPASAGGGGCHRPTTDEATATVELSQFCFKPTVVRVAAGTDVTFVNRDRWAHHVIGVDWWSEGDLEEGDAFTRRFGEDGNYPFACFYHRGMVGTVVVGDGSAAGARVPAKLASESAPAGGMPLLPFGLAIAIAGGAGLAAGRRLAVRRATASV